MEIDKERLEELKAIYKELTNDDWDIHSHRRDIEYSWALEQIDPNAKRILDAGCGGSPLLLYLKRHGLEDLTGIDTQNSFDNPTFSFKPEWNEKYNINYVQANLINYRSRVFDNVFCISVIEHIYRPIDRLKGLANLWENVRDGGKLIVTLDDDKHLLDGFAMALNAVSLVESIINIEDKVYGIALKKIKPEGMNEWIQQNQGI